MLLTFAVTDVKGVVAMLPVVLAPPRSLRRKLEKELVGAAGGAGFGTTPDGGIAEEGVGWAALVWVCDCGEENE